MHARRFLKNTMMWVSAGMVENTAGEGEPCCKNIQATADKILLL